MDEGKNVFVFELSGKYLDVSVLQIKDGIFEIKAANGDEHFGGEDYTNRLIEHCINEFKK